MKIYDNHQRTIDRVVEKFQNDPDYLAVLVAGSIAKGRAKENSDVDIMMLATDEAYARKLAQHDLIYNDTTMCDYEGGYVDGKVIGRPFLREVADHGSEPARAAFAGAFPVWSHEPELEKILEEILTYPEADRETKMKKFFSQVMLLNWYVGEAEKRSNQYLMMRMVSDIVLYSGRLLLAYNRILYPYHKWFMYELERAPEKPEQYMPLVHRILESPSKKNADALAKCVIDYRDWGVGHLEAVQNFLEDREWNWRDGHTPLEDW